MDRRAFALLALLACCSTVAGSATSLLTAGVDLRVVTEGASQLRCQVTWIEDAPLGRVEVHGPSGIRADSSSTLLLEQRRADGDRVRLTSALAGVRAGDGLEVFIDLSTMPVPSTVVVLAERVTGPVTHQVAVSVEVTAAGVRVGPPSAARLTLIADGPAGDDDVAAIGSGTVLVEPLDASAKLTADLFVEDHANIAIPDGPSECGGGSTVWAVQRVVSITTAPPEAVITGITVHVVATHPDMSDLEILFLHNWGTGSFLWNNGSGVNLDRTYTRDMYNQPLDGTGLEVNAYYTLAARDCVATSTGTLDYWSLRVSYDAVASIDLVATSIAASLSQVAPGGSVAATWSGQVTGSGTVGSPFTVGFYLSPDATVTTADVLLGQTTVGGVGPGDTFGETAPGRTLTIPPGTATGSYVLGLIVDSGGVIDETNEANNVTSTPLTVAVAPPDPNLRAASCAVSPTSTAPGGQLNLTWRGQNTGGTASGPFSWGVYLSTDATLDPLSDTLLHGPETSSGWSAGFDTGQVSTSVSLPGTLAAGTYHVGVVLDTAGTVTESNEGDNSCSSSVTVTSAPAGVTRWLVPAAASTPGVGSSDWRSEVAIVNRTASARSASLYFVARGTPWPGTLVTSPTSLAANQSLFLEDPLLAQNPTSGLLYVVLDAPGPVVTSRTYNLEPDGATYGQGIPALALDLGAAPDELVLPMVHSVPGRFRTNLGLIQTSSGSYQVEVTAYSPGGSILAVKTYTRSSGYDQVNDLFADLGLAGLSVRGAWLRVRLVSGAPQTWTCYASVVDALTGDPTFIAPVGGG